MFILLFLAVLLTIYITSFKDDFTEEHLTKLAPIVVTVVLCFLGVFILGLIGWGA